MGGALSGLGDRLKLVRERKPLIHNITNLVVMNWTANVLLSAGASPVMSHSPREISDMVAIANALVVNMGTLDDAWTESMRLGLLAARERDLPAVLDPVGAGATPYRTRTALDLLREGKPRVVRGNASEILALAGENGGTQGVDSSRASEEALRVARDLAKTFGTTICVSGASDFVTDGRRTFRIDNGHPLMTRVTGMGCAATSLVGVFFSLEPRLESVAAAMALMGVAGERAADSAKGPGSFAISFLDELAEIKPDTFERDARVVEI